MINSSLRLIISKDFHSYECSRQSGEPCKGKSVRGHLIRGETEAQRGQMTCPRPHSDLLQNQNWNGVSWCLQLDLSRALDHPRLTLSPHPRSGVLGLGPWSSPALLSSIPHGPHIIDIIKCKKIFNIHIMWWREWWERKTWRAVTGNTSLPGTLRGLLEEMKMTWDLKNN